jgi:hypothetical protein
MFYYLECKMCSAPALTRVSVVKCNVEGLHDASAVGAVVYSRII